MLISKRTTAQLVGALALALLPLTAGADVSDSGDLTIGGQGIIQGTMTVQGAGFSVGGATFTVAGGSVTLGGSLNAAVAGIKWADGTTSTTAAAGGSGGGGNVVFVSSVTSALITTTATIPADDSIPQNTEGVQILEASITPQATTNKLLIRAVLNASHTSSGYKIVLALFQDSTANAIAASVQNDGSPERIQNIVLTHVMEAGTTSATTFKIRTGAQPAGTLTVHGEGGSRLYGGALKSSLTVTEIEP